MHMGYNVLEGLFLFQTCREHLKNFKVVYAGCIIEDLFFNLQLLFGTVYMI